jgi:hypothetical protein
VPRLNADDAVVCGLVGGRFVSKSKESVCRSTRRSAPTRPPLLHSSSGVSRRVRRSARGSESGCPVFGERVRMLLERPVEAARLRHGLIDLPGSIADRGGCPSMRSRGFNLL